LKASGVSARKIWTQRETDELTNVLKSYYPQPIPNDKLEELAKKFDRTFCAIQNRMQKLRKTIQSQYDNAMIDKLNTQSSNLLNARASAATSMYMPLTPSSSLSASAADGTSSKRGESPTGPLQRLIQEAFVEMRVPRASKETIIRSIEDKYNLTQAYNSDAWKKTVAQLLSNGKVCRKIVGTFGLSSPRFHSKIDKRQATTMKAKLLYILSGLQERRADINTIFSHFIREFRESIDPMELADEESLKNLKSNIVKVLSQGAEFDRSTAKTIYELRDPS
jgi:hypothetical protein